MPRKPRSCLETAGACLSRRMYPVNALRDKLAAGGKFTAEEITETMNALLRAGYLDDRRYAEDAAGILARRGYGAVRIRRTLIEKGVPQELAADAVRALEEDPDMSSELDRALELLEKRSQLRRETDLLKRKAKACRFLAGRGFSAGVVFPAVSRWMGVRDVEDGSCGEY